MPYDVVINTKKYQSTVLKQGKRKAKQDNKQDNKKRFDPLLFCLCGFMVFVCFYVL